MLKKLSAFVFLGVLAILTLSAFSSVVALPVTRFGFAIGLSEFNAALPANFAESDGGTNFRIAHTWNGYYIPSVDVTGLLGKPVNSSGLNLPVVGADGISRQYEYGPALLATGFASITRLSVHAPLSEIFSLFPVQKVVLRKSTVAPLSEIFSLFPVPRMGIARQYEYGPALRATGFAIIARQYEYGPFSLATGFAAPYKKFNSGH